MEDGKSMKRGGPSTKDKIGSEQRGGQPREATEKVIGKLSLGCLTDLERGRKTVLREEGTDGDLRGKGRELTRGNDAREKAKSWC